MAKNGEAQATYVRLPVELHRAVKERAKNDERTMAQTIRAALRYYLATTAPLVSSLQHVITEDTPPEDYPITARVRSSATWPASSGLSQEEGK